ncbi:uncharacterized protein [Euwallacea similis]|uniref:uncharacterized protein n=1 Tax=Euwallacea similis TaxID=1736056 RepID=UPI00344FDF11
MLKWWFSGFVIISIGRVGCSPEKTGIHGNFTDDKFPNLFQMEDYYSCPPEYSFCTVSMKLVPQDDKSDIWKQLESWSVSDFHYNRTVVHRALCIPPCFRNGSQIKHFAESKANEELEAYNFTTQMLSYDCLKHMGNLKDFKFNLLLIGVHLSLVAVATLYHLYGGVGDKSNIVQKIVLCFSVIHYVRNASKVFKTKNVSKQTNISCMDGARFIFTLMVISAHAFLTLCTKKFKNPHEFEQFFESSGTQALLKLSLVAIQAYFTMSTWLLTRQILNIRLSEGEFSIRHCIIMFARRIARIWPPLIYLLFGPGALYFYFSNGPGGYNMVNKLYGACTSSSKYWSLLHVTNLFRNFDICHFGLWSLSLDMQYYLVNLIFFYIVLKYKIDIKKGLAILTAIAYLVSAFQIYSNNISFSLWINIKLFTTFSDFNKPELSYIYFGFFVNYLSSLVGTLLGYVDFQTRDMKRPVAYEKTYKVITMCLVFSFLLQSHDFSVLATSLLSPLFKATYSLGIGMIIYGMSRNIIQGPLKWMLEHKYMQLLASYSYIVYMFHFMWVVSRETHNSSLLEFRVPKVLWGFFQDFIISFAIGLFGTITISVPALRLEQLILPPIHRKVHGQDNKTESKKM